MVVLSLVECLIEFGIDGLIVPHQSLKILEFLDIAIQESVEFIALFFQSLPLVLESFHLSKSLLTVIAKFLFS
jgi:hypothetical protein